MPAQLAEIETAVNPAQQVTRRNVILEIERVEQLPLPARTSSHHGRRSRTYAFPSA
jgi:hypothetical protein